MGQGIAVTRRCSPNITPLIRKVLVQRASGISSVWLCDPLLLRKTLQLAQNRAARLALNCSFKTNVAMMHHRLVWLTVEAKLTSRIITFSRNAIIEGKPDFFRDQLFNAGLKHNYQTRQVSSGYLGLPKPNSELLKKTVIYRATQQWNSLPGNIKRIKSKYLFKRSIKQILMRETTQLE